jgi:chromosome segregation ATPase
MEDPRKASVKRIQQLQAQGLLFTPSAVPDHVSQLLVDLCDVTVAHDAQLFALTSSLTRFDSSITAIKTDLRALTEATSTFLTLRSELFKTVERVANLEEAHSDLNASVTQNSKLYDITLGELSTVLDSTTNDLRNEVQDLRRTFTASDDPESLQNLIGAHVAQVDVAPLVRGFYRCARRLDGMDEIVCDMRRENENALKLVSAFADHLDEIKANFSELAFSCASIRGAQDNRMRFLQKSIHNLEASISSAWSAIEGTARIVHHTTSNASAAVEKLQIFIQALTSRPFPRIDALSDALLEAVDVREVVQAKKTQFEEDRKNFHYPPADHVTPYSWKQGSQLEWEKIKEGIKDADAKGKFSNVVLRLDVERIKQTVEELERVVRNLEPMPKSCGEEESAVPTSPKREQPVRHKKKSSPVRSPPREKEKIQQVMELPVQSARQPHSDLYLQVYGDDSSTKPPKKANTARRAATQLRRLVSTTIREPSLM